MTEISKDWIKGILLLNGLALPDESIEKITKDTSRLLENLGEIWERELGDTSPATTLRLTRKE
jgi:hypothetical protein